MKTALVLAAALGLSVSAAAACPMKRDTTASTDKMTTASITTASTTTPLTTASTTTQADTKKQ